VLAAHAEGVIQCITTVEVIQEFTHTFARRRTRSEAARIARFYRRFFRPEITAVEDLELGLTLYEQYSDLNAFDAALAAVTLNHGMDWLISADRAFASVRHLPWIDPAGPDLDRLLSTQS
jgi:predicted nucleic acid-binding protein